MRAVVTGGTGFIGGHLLAALVARGDEVVSVERAGAERRWIAHLPLTVSATGLEDTEALARACEGVDTVFHLAGRSRARSEPEYFRANVTGTNAVMWAASAQPDPPRVVLVSSLSALGPSRDGRPLDAATEPRPLTPYGVSKLQAEAIVRSWGNRVPATILRPTSVYGPRERGVYLFFRMVQRGFAVGIGDWEHQVQLLHVHDLVRALIGAAATPCAAGRTWCVAYPERLTWRSVADEIGRACGRAPRKFTVPPWAAHGMARVIVTAAALRGRAAGLNPDRVRELAQRSWICDAERLWSDLDLTPEVPLRMGAPATLAWYREAGWLPPRGAAGI